MKRILLVDDEVAVATIFETALKSSDYEVKITSSGKEGLETAHNEKFDLILVDQMLPDMTGNEMLKALKSDEVTKSMPVAMLSNFGQENMVKEALYTGAVDYILKYQVSTDDLVNKVKSIMGDNTG